MPRRRRLEGQGPPQSYQTMPIEARVNYWKLADIVRHLAVNEGFVVRTKSAAYAMVVDVMHSLLEAQYGEAFACCQSYEEAIQFMEEAGAISGASTAVNARHRERLAKAITAERTNILGAVMPEAGSNESMPRDFDPRFSPRMRQAIELASHLINTGQNVKIEEVLDPPETPPVEATNKNIFDQLKHVQTVE